MMKGYGGKKAPKMSSGAKKRGKIGANSKPPGSRTGKKRGKKKGMGY